MAVCRLPGYELVNRRSRDASPDLSLDIFSPGRCSRFSPATYSSTPVSILTLARPRQGLCSYLTHQASGLTDFSQDSAVCGPVVDFSSAERCGVSSRAVACQAWCHDPALKDFSPWHCPPLQRPTLTLIPSLLSSSSLEGSSLLLCHLHTPQLGRLGLG